MDILKSVLEAVGSTSEPASVERQKELLGQEDPPKLTPRQWATLGWTERNRTHRENKYKQINTSTTQRQTTYEENENANNN